MSEKWINEERLVRALEPVHAGLVPGLCLFEAIDSTNAEALRRLKSMQSSRLPPPMAFIARTQTAGRGRRGREWMSEPDAGLYMSLLRSFDLVPDALQGLSLVVGLAVYEALKTLVGIGEEREGISLKWPNDILYQGCKLGGILLELQRDEALSHVVIGIGLNLDLPPDVDSLLDRPTADLKQITGERVEPVKLVTALLNQLGRDIAVFEEEGFAPFIARWNRVDAYMGKNVRLQQDSKWTEGISRGVDSSGGLLLEPLNDDGVTSHATGEGGLLRFEGGELSPTLRLNEDRE